MTGNVTWLSPVTCDPVKVRVLVAEDEEVPATAVAPAAGGLAIDVVFLSRSVQ